jgi:hypothetical protein
MADEYGLCETALIAQFRTLADPYFPAIDGNAAGWQVSRNDTIIQSGGVYFIVVRPGRFTRPALRSGGFIENEWHSLAIIYMQYQQHDGLWDLYRAYRASILDLLDRPLRDHGIWSQEMSAIDDPGYLIDSQGNYTNFVVQTLDVTMKQRKKK